MLADKELLLVLDNCEHLLGAVARLVTRVERECPGVVVLATSREGLAVDGEQMIALPPLAIGDPTDDIERLVATDAVSLFVERATSRQGRLCPDRQQRPQPSSRSASASTVCHWPSNWQRRGSSR